MTDNVLLGTILYLSVFAWLALKAHGANKRSREREAEWDAKPSGYTLEELTAWFVEHSFLEDAGLLDPGQPTPWSHAAHEAFKNGSRKDRVLLRMAIEGARESGATYDHA